ncbi:MAG: methyltransferase, partial [Microthrixaceae bacterium]
MQHLLVPQGEFDLRTHNHSQQNSLRAWDAADEYLLEQIAELGVLSGSVVLVNDRCGALAVVLAPFKPYCFGDSYVSQLTTVANLKRNNAVLADVSLVGSLDLLPARVDYLFIKVPKTLALLEDQLLRLAPSVQVGTVVIAAGMTKHIHNSTLALFERILGVSTTSLAKKKARLIFVAPRETTKSIELLKPSAFTLDPGRLKVRSYPGVFSAERLDIGSSFFIDHLPDQAGQIRIVDLGCGNGLVGLVLAIDNPDADLIFV